jgi:hypothetical protein
MAARAVGHNLKHPLGWVLRKETYGGRRTSAGIRATPPRRCRGLRKTLNVNAPYSAAYHSE